VRWGADHLKKRRNEEGKKTGKESMASIGINLGRLKTRKSPKKASKKIVEKKVAQEGEDAPRGPSNCLHQPWTTKSREKKKRDWRIKNKKRVLAGRHACEPMFWAVKV